MPLRIVLDAMGSDQAPSNDVQGAIEALKQTDPDRFSIVLVGRVDPIEEALDGVGADLRKRIEIRPADDVIAMDAEPAQAVRRGAGSSIVVGLKMQADNEADAFVSAGNTGAVMAASTFVLGRIPGISRPTIASQFPSEKGFTIVADVGANVDTKPQNLYEFAVMTSIYAEEIFGKKNPSVGLLNVGEESSKGEERVVQAHKLLAESGLNFVGNVEGRDIFGHGAEVIICDGFVGNILLKFAESINGLLRARLGEYAEKGFVQKARVGMARSTLREVFRQMNYEEYGGVPLLGVEGVSIIGHGGSSPRAIAAMILKAEEMVRKEVVKRIKNSELRIQN